MLESGHADNISDVGGSGVNDDGDDEDDETGKSMAAQISHDDDDDDDEDDDGNKKTGYWCGKSGKNFGRAKQVILYPFRKAKKQLRRKSTRASSSVSTTTRRTVSSDKRVGGGANGVDGSVHQGCGFCFTKLLISDSKNGSQTTDPNNRKFTHEILKVLLEKNDFYSKESNPHLDIQVDTRQKH